MKIRFKDKGATKWVEAGTLGNYLASSIDELVVYLKIDDEDYLDSISMSCDIEYWYEKESRWVKLEDAFKDKILLSDNHNTGFGPPIDDICLERGYNY